MLKDDKYQPGIKLPISCYSGDVKKPDIFVRYTQGARYNYPRMLWRGNPLVI